MSAASNGHQILARARENSVRGGFIAHGVQEFYEKFDCVTAFLCDFRGVIGVPGGANWQFCRDMSPRPTGHHILAGARGGFWKGGFLARGVQEFYEKFDCVTAFLCHFRGSFGCLVVGFVTVWLGHVCCIEWSSNFGRGA